MGKKHKGKPPRAGEQQQPPPQPASASASVTTTSASAATTTTTYGSTPSTATATAVPTPTAPPAPRGLASFCHDMLGFETLGLLTRDGWLLIAARSCRMAAFGFLSVILVLYLRSMGYGEARIGLLFSLTLLGDAFVSLFITARADALGRRTMLITSAVLKLVTGLIYASTSQFWLLLAASTLGVISPSGKELGPFLPVEHAALTQIIDAAHRTRLIAWHDLFGKVSSAIGALICGGLVTYFIDGPPRMSEYDAYRAVMVIYACLASALIAIFYALSPAIEPLAAAASTARVKDTPVKQFLGLHESKGIVVRLSLLFMLDAFAGGFILQAMLSNWFALTFGTKPAVLGTIVFISNLTAGVSSLFAAHLAKLFGLVVTMVFSHLPANVMLILVPLMPTELLAIVVLCARYTVANMDVPCRNSYVMAVVSESERSAAGGITNIVRSVGAATAPYLSGLLYEHAETRNVPFYIAGGLKIAYDLLLLAAFVSVKPPEEREKERETRARRAARQQRRQQQEEGEEEDERAPLTGVVTVKV